MTWDYDENLQVPSTGKDKTCIKKYGSEAGYNISFGGHGGNRKFSSKDEDKIVETYLHEDLSFEAIGRRFNCDGGCVKNILIRHGVSLRTEEEKQALLHKIIGIPIVRCDKNWNELEYYDSSTLAATWLIKNKLTQTNNTETIGRRLRQFAATGKKTYGFFWKMPTVSKEEQARKATKYLEQQKKYASLNLYRKGKTCPICGVLIADKSTYCSKHRSIAQPLNKKRLIHFMTIPTTSMRTCQTKPVSNWVKSRYWETGK